MPEAPPSREEVDRFIVEEIDSVPQLEALLLFWNNRPKNWSSAELARELYVSTDLAHEILRYLAHRQLVVEVEEGAGRYALQADREQTERLLSSLDRIYRRELVRVSTLIHAKASRAVRDFASAFRFKKD
jgi:hypothetical protein